MALNLPSFSNIDMQQMMQQILQDPATAAKAFATQPPPPLPAAPAPAAAVNPLAALGTPLTAQAPATPATAQAPADPQTSAADKFAQAAAGVQAPPDNTPRMSLGNAPRPGLGGQLNPQILQLLMQMMGGQGGQTAAPTLGSLIRPGG